MANGPKNTNSLVVLAVMVITAVVAAVIVIKLRPDQDNTALIVIIFGFVAQITASILGLMKVEMKVEETKAQVVQTHVEVEKTHHVVNSRMDEFRESLEKAAILKADVAREEGKAAGTVIGAAAANVRTDDLNPPR